MPSFPFPESLLRACFESVPTSDRASVFVWVYHERFDPSSPNGAAEGVAVNVSMLEPVADLRGMGEAWLAAELTATVENTVLGFMVDRGCLVV